MSDCVNLSPMLDQGVSEDGIELLSSINDNYEGVMVEMKEPMDSKVFLPLLRASLSVWRHQEGFWYHHAEPSFLMLVYWIPDSVSTIPANASHRVGVGAIVVTEKREILVVQERTGMFRGKGIWKIPTGVVDAGEDISVAAAREVKEETGIDTDFVEVLAFRQTHKSFLGKSDLFFLCFLRPLSFDIQKQESEIEAAQWMSLEELKAQPAAQKHNLLRYTYDLCLAKIDKDYAGFSAQPLSSTFSERLDYLYVNTRDLIQSCLINLP
ncbi:hypothetical protein Ancab_024955 [Ancistrocladus abbreviatus]